MGEEVKEQAVYQNMFILLYIATESLNTYSTRYSCHLKVSVLLSPV